MAYSYYARPYYWPTSGHYSVPPRRWSMAPTRAVDVFGPSLAGRDQIHNVYDDMPVSRPNTTGTLPTDTVVFIVGPSRSGKSWLLNTLLRIANTPDSVDGGQESSTADICERRCRFRGMQGDIVLVDTPSFYTFETTDGEETLERWMVSTYVVPCKAVGILFMLNTASNPLDANLALSRHLEAFGRTCPRQLAPSAIHIVLTVADGTNFSTEGAANLVTQLQRQADNIGASICKPLFDGTPETTWEIMQGLLNEIGGEEDRLALRKVILRRAALEGAPLTRQDDCSALISLADVLHERVQEDRGRRDFNDVITLRRAALKLTPPGHPERPVYINILATLLHERFEREDSMEDLTEIIALRRAVLELTPSGHPDHLSSLVNLADSLEERFQREDSMEDWTEIITHRRAALELTPPGHSERLTCLINLGNCLNQQFKKGGVMEHLTEIITVRRAALELTPPGHPDRFQSLVNLSNCLDQRFKREDSMEDLMEAITYRRAALRLMPSEHRDRLEPLVGLADCLDQQFRREGDAELLMDIISLRRAALRLTPPGHPERFASLINLANCLDQQVKVDATLADLQEIISLRRGALECAPLSPSDSDECMLRICFAACLRESYLKLGRQADLDEAMLHARIALASCPPEQYSQSRDCLASCIDLKIQNWISPVHGTGVMNSSTRSSNIKQLIWNVVNDVMKTVPLRLLNTHTGMLCNRTAQLSHFRDSCEYNQLLSAASTRDGQELEAWIRKAVVAFFRFASLSHKWGDDEPLLHDIEGASVYDLIGKTGLAKLQKFCLLALKHDCTWAWSDTCCIDKGSSAELQEAIGCMFAWYRQSAVTIVYLSDVSNSMSLTNSIWFERGWTLQELLAPHRILFFTQDWSLYMDCETSNHKTDDTILKELGTATGIGKWHLQNFCPGTEDARSRLQWTSARRTTRPEDVAYSLFGIFDLHLTVQYGVPADEALGRLLAAIISRSGDISILDWVGQASSFNSCLPIDLVPYRTMPYVHASQSGPPTREGVDPESARKLCSALTELQFPRFINHVLMLPSIIHQINVIKATGASKPPCYVYEIHATGLIPLELRLSLSLQEGSGADLSYILVRPWHPKLPDLLAGDTDAHWKLLERLGKPFNALLLTRLPGKQYKRIAADCIITARVRDLASIIDSELQMLDIV
ncbi:hypothetical protein EDC04DRAFT_2672883 [Pisolithus marmoratus]|nr:hypothetical protein EDC04DRAFT_2672883 [Pisolithus marmoratus]